MKLVAKLSETCRDAPLRPLAGLERLRRGRRAKHAARASALAPSSLAPPSLSPPPLTPPPDVAFGAYQRGEYAVAMREAKKRAADNPKDTAALALIGRLYAEGAGVARDHSRRWTGFVARPRRRRARGLSRWRRAVSDAPGPKEREAAKGWLEKAAAQNHAAAINLLGEMALDNNGVFADFERAADYFRRAAELGDTDAKYALGELYKHGKGVAKDDGEAAKWFKAAADDNHAAAMVELAILEFNGSGVERDLAGAAKLFRKAAEMGNAVAENRLAISWRTGAASRRTSPRPCNGAIARATPGCRTRASINC